MTMAFECAVADFNRHNAKRVRFTLNRFGETDLETVARAPRIPDGTLSADNQDIEIRCESGFGSGEATLCVLLLPLKQETLLAGLEAPQLFNLVASVEPGVSLAFEPQIRMDSEMIRVIGVEAVVALKCVNRHSLEDVIGRLLVSASCLQSILSAETGSRDYWQERLYCASRIPCSASCGSAPMQQASLEL
jgi:hypothetical protein